MTAPVLRMEGVAVAYRSATGETPVLTGIDLVIHAGEKVSLMGPSGSGKSTLLAIVAGLLRADAGMIEVDGVPVVELGASERAELRGRRIGVAKQSGNLIPFLTSVENVELALECGGRGRDRARAMELLHRLGVGARAGHLPRQLSGGETQRVALAAAVAADPALLLADEMVSAVDTATASDIVEDLFASPMAVLFVTHEPALADRAERRLWLHDGKVVTR